MAGLVLAGGRSRRFGAEKAVTQWGGGVLMDAPVQALSAVCDRVIVSARPGSGAEDHGLRSGLPCVRDRPGDVEGPLAGIRRGLDWAFVQGFDWLAVAACDTAGVAPVHYRRLLAGIGGSRAVVLRSGAGQIEPLISIWAVASGRAAVIDALADGGHPPIAAVLQTLEVVAVAVESHTVVNVNRPSDLPAW